MFEYLKNLLVYYLSEDTLVRFRWYRKRLGGLWCHSNLMGWEKCQKDHFARDINLMFQEPFLYDYGDDIELYEPFDWNRYLTRYLRKTDTTKDELNSLVERIEIDEREGDHWTTDAVVYELKELLK